MKPTALLLALVGTLAGAGLWALISILTGYEIGYAAWAVGGLVGGAALLGGGEGNASGAVCGVLVLVAIFGGRWFAFDSVAHAEVKKEFGGFLTAEMYEQAMDNARTWSSMPKNADVRPFMIERGFTEGRWPDEVSPMEIEEFYKVSVPQLKWIHENQPSYPEWKDESITQIVDTVTEHVSKTEMIKESLGLMDVVFGFLGIATAFRLGSQGRGPTGPVRMSTTSGSMGPSRTSSLGTPSGPGGPPGQPGQSGPTASSSPETSNTYGLNPPPDQNP